MLITVTSQQRIANNNENSPGGMSRKRRKRINYTAANADCGTNDTNESVPSSSNILRQDDRYENIENESDVTSSGVGIDEDREHDTSGIHSRNQHSATEGFRGSHLGMIIVALILVVLPSCATLWNSVIYDIRFISAFKVMMIQIFWIFVTTTIFVIIGRLYMSRNNIMNWTLAKLNDSLTLNGIGNIHDQLHGNKDVYVQTDEAGEVADIIRIKKKNEIQLKFARRQYLKMKRTYAQRLVKLKTTSRERGEFLSRLQLKFPDMEKEIDLLIAEKEAIEKQHEEEKRRNRELIGRFQRLQQQLGRAGQQKHTLNHY